MATGNYGNLFEGNLHFVSAVPVVAVDLPVVVSLDPKVAALEAELDALKQENQDMLVSLEQANGQLGARIKPPPALPTTMPPAPKPVQAVSAPIVTAPTNTVLPQPEVAETLPETQAAVTQPPPPTQPGASSVPEVNVVEYLEAQVATLLGDEAVLPLTFSSANVLVFEGSLLNGAARKEVLLATEPETVTLSVEASDVEQLNSGLLASTSAKFGSPAAVGDGVMWTVGDAQLLLSVSENHLTLVKQPVPVSTFSLKSGVKK